MFGHLGAGRARSFCTLAHRHSEGGPGQPLTTARDYLEGPSPDGYGIRAKAVSSRLDIRMSRRCGQPMSAAGRPRSSGIGVVLDGLMPIRHSVSTLVRLRLTAFLYRNDR